MKTAVTNFASVMNAFGEDIGSDLWKYLSDGLSEKAPMDSKMFSKHFSTLFDQSLSSYVELLAPAEHMLRTCAHCANVEPNENDEIFIAALSNEMEKAKNVKDLMEWITSTCPRLFDSVQCQLKNVFISPVENHIQINDSNILSPFQMWFLQCTLPDIYFSTSDDNEVTKGWTSLYSSFQQGISTVRFQQFVFSYRGPTVTIIQMNNYSVVVFAVDQEWRNSGVKFGASDCVFLQLAPVFKKCVRSSSVYCNFGSRNQQKKLTFGDEFELDSEFTGVTALETFGCGSSDVLKDKQLMDERRKRQIERNKRVPLPGNWDENPDRLLLEIAGVCSNENHREIFSRKDA